MLDVAGLMSQVKSIQDKLQKEQDKIASQEYVGKSGGGLVTIVINGMGNIIKLEISPLLMVPNEKTILEDLVVAAFSDAKSKLSNTTASILSGMMGGLPIPPGFKM